MRLNYHNFAPVKVLVDEMPLTYSHQKLSDYSAYQILSLTALPLTRFIGTKLEGLAASNWTVSEDKLTYTFYLKKDLYWYDGTSVDGYDYSRGFEALRSDPSNRFSQMLFDLKQGPEALAASSDQIVFNLRQPNCFFPELLSILAFSPIHKTDPNLTAGAYFINNIGKDKVELEKNPHYSVDDSHDINNIEFHLITNKTNFDIDKIIDNQFDRSCDTAFPYKRYLELKSRTQKVGLNMAMTLSPGNRYVENSPEEYRSFFSIIDKRAISEDLYGVLTPINSYLDLFSSQTKNNSEPQSQPDPLTFNLKIAYEDYFPNEQILNQIAEQSKSHGISIELVQEAYGSRSADCHLRFEIRQSPLPTPYLFVKSEVCSRHFHQHSSRAAESIRLFSDYQVNGSQEALIKLDAIFREEQITFPLFEVPGLVIHSDRVCKENCFVPGNNWKFA